MNNLEIAIQERIQENERHARTLRSQSRHRLRRLNKELYWVLSLIKNIEVGA